MLLWKVGGLLLTSKDMMTLDISGEEISNNCFGTEGSKECKFNCFSFASQPLINTHLNGQYLCLLICGKNWRYLKQICFEKGNMGLFVEQRDQNYCRIPARGTQGEDRYSV